MNNLFCVSVLTLSLLASAPFALAHEKVGGKGKGVKCMCSEGAAHDCKGDKCEKCAKSHGEATDVKGKAAPKAPQ